MNNEEEINYKIRNASISLIDIDSEIDELQKRIEFLENRRVIILSRKIKLRKFLKEMEKDENEQ